MTSTTTEVTKQPIIAEILPPQTTDCQDVAQGIIDVLNMDKMKMWSWGTSNLRIGTMMKDKIPMPALIFKVNGFQHKGDVVIALNRGIDLYEVHLLQKKRVIKKSLDRVYFDDLTDAIDRLVETGDLSKAQYDTQVKNTYNWQ